MARLKGTQSAYIRTLDKAGMIDYYEKQLAFWESVVKKYPRPANLTQFRHMKRILEELKLE